MNIYAIKEKSTIKQNFKETFQMNLVTPFIWKQGNVACDTEMTTPELTKFKDTKIGFKGRGGREWGKEEERERETETRLSEKFQKFTAKVGCCEYMPMGTINVPVLKLSFNAERCTIL